MSMNNIRSFRYDDETAKILNDFAGNSLNEKFNNLVAFCFTSISARQKEIVRLDKCIVDKKNSYNDLCKKLAEVDKLIQDLKTIQYYGDQAVKRSKGIFKNV